MSRNPGRSRRCALSLAVLVAFPAGAGCRHRQTVDDGPEFVGPGDRAPEAGLDTPTRTPCDNADAGAVLCPPSMPVPSTSCAPDGLICQYGDDPRCECRRTFDCYGAGWVEVPRNCPELHAPVNP